MKPKDILEGQETFEEDYPVISIYDALSAMEQFGEQCFNAARQQECTTVGDIDDVPGVVHSNKFSNFEDYLNSINNDD